MTTTALLPLGVTARLLHVPAKWLRAEAEAGRLPHLRAGNTILFAPDLIEQLLVERARCAPGPDSQEEPRRV
jgi:hypothetical protein